VPKVTAICYLSSIFFYGLGYYKMFVINNALIVKSNDYAIATCYFFLVIFLAVIGSLFYYVNNREQKLLEWKILNAQKKQVGNIDD